MFKIVKKNSFDKYEVLQNIGCFIAAFDPFKNSKTVNFLSDTNLTLEVLYLKVKWH